MRQKDELLECIDEKIDESVRKSINDILPRAVEEEVYSVLNVPLSIKQVSIITGRSRDSIYKMCQRNRIPYTKIDGVIHLNIKDVSEILLCLKQAQ